jgi:hypothetical protein
MTLRPIHSVFALMSGCSRTEYKPHGVGTTLDFGDGCNIVTVKD